jgi:hypothetical protein
MFHATEDWGLPVAGVASRMSVPRQVGHFFRPYFEMCPDVHGLCDFGRTATKWRDETRRARRRRPVAASSRATHRHRPDCARPWVARRNDPQDAPSAYCVVRRRRGASPARQSRQSRTPPAR